jgi:hypothetical protein
VRRPRSHRVSSVWTILYGDGGSTGGGGGWIEGRAISGYGARGRAVCVAESERGSRRLGRIESAPSYAGGENR